MWTSPNPQGTPRIGTVIDTATVEHATRGRMTMTLTLGSELDGPDGPPKHYIDLYMHKTNSTATRPVADEAAGREMMAKFRATPTA